MLLDDLAVPDRQIYLSFTSLWIFDLALILLSFSALCHLDCFALSILLHLLLLIFLSVTANIYVVFQIICSSSITKPGYKSLPRCSERYCMRGKGCCRPASLAVRRTACLLCTLPHCKVSYSLARQLDVLSGRECGNR